MELTKNQTHSNTAAQAESEHLEDALLWLPSSIPVHARRRVSCKGLPKIEEKLRTVQLDNSLETIRHILRIKARMVAFKNKNYRGQHEGTRSRTIIDCVHQKAQAAAEKYRAARSARLALTGPGQWENKHRVLLDADIRGYQDPNRLRPSAGRRGVREDDEIDAIEALCTQEEVARSAEAAGAVPADFELLPKDRSWQEGTGESHHTVSWIWTVKGVINSDSGKISDDILRAEWAKSRARANRSCEEVNLLREEMQRTVKFLKWRLQWWKDKPTSWPGVPEEVSEGIQAYAMEQADIQQDLAASFKLVWETPLADFEDDDTNGKTSLPDDSTGEGDEDDDRDAEFSDDEAEAEDLDKHP